MKTCLINLHNHLLDGKGNFYNDEKIKKYFNNSEKAKCQKIYAFTDHFSEMLECHHDKDSFFDNYKKKVEEIKTDVDVNKRKINILVGLELDVLFSNDDDQKHIICIFKSVETMLEKIRNYYLDDCKNDKILVLNDKKLLLAYSRLLSDAICIPHFKKGDVKRNFTDSQIDEWNKIECLPRISCVETNSSLRTLVYLIPKLFDEELGDYKYHYIVGNDRDVSPLVSFIFFEDEVLLNKSEQIFENIKSFFAERSSPKHHPSLSLSHNNHEIFLYGVGDIVISLSLIIYGHMGSGKTYLCNKFINALDNTYKNNKKDNDFLCSISQGEYISKDNDKELMEEHFHDIIHEWQSGFDKISEMFSKKFCDDPRVNSNTKHITKKVINNYLGEFIDDTIRNIKENYGDDNRHLMAKERYGNFNTITSKYSTYFNNTNDCIDKIIDLIKLFNKIKNYFSDTPTIDMIKKSTNILFDTVEKMLQNLRSFDLENELVVFTNKICKDMNDIINDLNHWEYTFNNVDFAKYYFHYLLVEEFNNFINESNEEDADKYRIDCGEYCGEKYSLKLKLQYRQKKSVDIKNYFMLSLSQKLQIKKHKFIDASFGERKKFMVLDKIRKSKYKFLIFDEPDYSFDNYFIKNYLAKELVEILKSQSKKLWLVTHNHVLWSEIYGAPGLNKKISYIECKYNNNNNDDKWEYKQSQKSNFSLFLDNYEADEESYNLRKKLYGKYKEGEQ